MKLLFRVLLFLLFSQPLAAQLEFSQDNATQLLRILCVEIGPRPMGSAAEQRAMKFAVEKFREYGCDSAYVMPMLRSSRANTNSGIAVGVKRGATQRIILIGGHMDSAGPEIPGADDDGSGAASVMELARVLSKRHTQSTIMFCCWGGEEEGLEGSQYFADHFENIDSVSLMLQIDMANGLGSIDLDPDTRGFSAPKWLVRAAAEEFHNLGYEHLRYPWHFFSMNYTLSQGAGSDHESFLQRGIPSVDFSTDVNKPIHTARDNFENFDPRGLKRTGDVVLRLVERFDGGVPAVGTDHYWLILIGSTPIFLPVWGMWAFVIFSILLSVIAFIAVRQRREPRNTPGWIRWSGFKMIPLTLIVVAFGWFSSDIIALVKGVRYPWFGSIPSYYLLAGVAMVAGTWIALALSRRMGMSRCPYVFFKRSAIILILFSGLLAWANIKIALHPAMALVLISLAILVRHPLLKLVILVLSPLWMLRLVFSEWDETLFRTLAPQLPGGLGRYLLLSALMIVGFTVYLLPFFYAGAAVLRDSDRLQWIFRVLKSKLTLGLSLISFCGLSAYLWSQPSYNRLWFREVKLIDDINLTRHAASAILSGSEYLTGVSIHHGGTDTTITSKTLFAKLTPRVPLDTSWLEVSRSESRKESGETTTYDILLSLRTKLRPYTVTVSYSSGGKDVPGFRTQWQYRHAKFEKRIEFYSYPDTLIMVPVTFEVGEKDSVKERIEVTFDTLAYPLLAERELTSFIQRTTYSEEHIYKR